MLLMQLVHGDVDLDGDHLVKKLLMLMLSTASSFMEMLVWMGPPGEKAVDVDVVHSQLHHHSFFPPGSLQGSALVVAQDEELLQPGVQGR